MNYYVEYVGHSLLQSRLDKWWQQYGHINIVIVINWAWPEEWSIKIKLTINGLQV